MLRSVSYEVVADPNAVLSELAEPIIYYIDRTTPAKRILYSKAGIGKWQEALEMNHVAVIVGGSLVPHAD